MLLHQDHKFFYKNIATFQVPNNVYLDPSPDPCPIEGMVLYTKDQCAQVDINFVDTDADACAFLEEERECYESFQCLKPISEVTTNGIKGFTMTYATKHHIYEEYTFNLPGEEPTLLNICIEQKKYKQAAPTQYAQLVTELLRGIELA